MVVAGILVTRLGQWVGGRFQARTRWLAVVAGVPIVLVGIALMGPILLVWAPYCGIRDAWRYRRFLRKNAGRCYLVWGPRHAWHDFIVNNVLPVLPDGMDSVRADPDRMMAADFRMALIRSKVRLPPKPFVVSVTHGRIKACTVNDRLQELKKSQGIDAEVRGRVACILGEVARQLS
jgi:hypothetical protein